MEKKSVVKTYTGIRKENLIRNNGKYVMYDKPLGMPIGLTTDVYHNENGKPQQIHKGGLLGYTYDVNGEYGKELNDSYGREVDNIKHYSTTNVKPTFSVNDYEGYNDYVSYIGEVYGIRETYAGHLAGLMGVRDGLEGVAYDIFPNAEGQTFADTINETLQYTDVQYAMEGDKVGIVRNIDVAKALGGVITTNVNNYSGKDTRLGMISNQLYAKALFNAAHFNSLRRTKYITPELEKVYGNNLSNVYNLSSLFLLPDGQPRLIEPLVESFIKEYEGKDVKEYLINFIPEYNEKQEEIQEWNSRDRYFGFSKSIDSENEISRRFNPNLVDEPKMVVSNMKEPSTTYKFYEEGDKSNVNAFDPKSSDINTIDGFKGETIAIKKEGKDILNTTNKLFKNRLFDTLVGRFHTSGDKENTLTQSAVHPTFGLSKGRNLLTKNAWETDKGENINGYDNPYCRVWTYHNQYSKMTDLIRPFTKGSGDTFMGVGELQKDWYSFRNYKGDERLGVHSVLNKNGMVNITPTGKGFDGIDEAIDIKQCMFSIENLAWKDVNISGKGGYRFENGDFVMDYQNTLSEEQRGPNGGRIMWFPPYDIDFQETSSAEWHEDVFIGRGEPIYTYTNTRRNGSLSFTLLIDHPSVLNYWMMDKKNTEDPVNGEQTLLRYFAGCEPIAPSEDVNLAILRGEFLGGSKEIKPKAPNKDIIFNTYFPNNYSGVDVKTKNDVIDILFGGQYVNTAITPTNGTLETFGGEDETLFLGYEMGLNPISTTFFEIGEGTSDVKKMLAEVLNEKTALEKYGNMNFLEVTDIKVEFSDFEENGENFLKYNRKDNLSKENGYDNESNTISNDITNLENQISGVSEEIKVMETKLSNLVEGTVEYEMLIIDIKKAKKELEDIKAIHKTKVNSFNNIQKEKEKNGAFRDLCNNKFGETNVKAFVKTTPIYCVTRKGRVLEQCTISNTKEDAYATYLLYKIKKFNSIDEYFKNGLSEKVCSVYEDGGYDYYGVADVVKTNNVVYNEYNTFTDKREFSKSSWPFGVVEITRGGKTVKKYYYKNKKGNIKESDTKEEQVKVLVHEGILSIFPNEDAFKKSGEFCGCLDDSNEYVYYVPRKFESVDEALKTIKNSLTKEEVTNAYKGHMYGSPTEIQGDVDYWGIQYYCVYEENVSDGVNEIPVGYYSSKQEYIINHELKDIMGDASEHLYIPNGDGDIAYLYKDTKRIITKYAYGNIVSMKENNDIIQEVDELVQHQISYNADKTLKAYVYPHDERLKDSELSDAKNYVDFYSFGLNSTYEKVKEIQPDITCSFGEFYAAVKEGGNGGMYTDFVLACEEAVLRKMGKTEDELKTKMTEASERIKDIASTLKSYKTNILSMTVEADASAEGNIESNNTLAKDRAETLVGYLNGLKFGGASATTTTTQASEKEKQDGSVDISSLLSKKDRKSTVKIKIGNKPGENVIPDGSRGSGKNGKFGEDATDFMSGSTKYRRYDDERLFFSMLKEEDNIAYTNLIKKVRYFSPAFHSITPEGFNARLTFLQQCTRQGPTITASEVGTSGSTAANLAFGRAPFCVLRLGDFLNTRIVVKSVNITYPDNMWDLNHDGIGAQFMMAKVSMQIEIIGGSDISAPIKRLQNAVSFNYYANTSIYDNRSDIAQYNGNGTSSDVRTWNPSLKPRQNS